MNPFQTHHSVRVKGTENNYEPVACVDTGCRKRVPHMHCPLCVQTECYQDPVILKAHYRVKHVDKGIEFAGLKVLRCCDHCDIVGSIKGAKQFKGAHWHCYKCKNGFNRRDEAVKHYRTHFRNPQTTFQIQIAQEVNRSFSAEIERATNIISTPTLTTLHPSLAEAAMMSVTAATTQDSGLTTTPVTIAMATNGKTGDSNDEHHVAVAANETVGTSEGQTIMIIQSDEPIDTMSVSDQESNLEIESSAPSDWAQTKLSLERRVKELTERNSQLELEYNRQVHNLKTEMENLKLQMQIHIQELNNSQRREQELVSQLSIPLNDKIAQTLNQLKADHENLLHQQLAVLKRTYSKNGLPGEEEAEEEDDDQLTKEGEHQPQDQSPILVISDPSGQAIQGSIVTAADGSQVFVSEPHAGQSQQTYPMSIVKQDASQEHVLEADAGQEHVLEADAGQEHVLEAHAGQEHVLEADAGHEHVLEADAGHEHVLEAEEHALMTPEVSVADYEPSGNSTTYTITLNNRKRQGSESSENEESENKRTRH